jgi:hypothetical protein
MTCAACGGDGQIEYGAYRGDETTETRDCQLCGGRPTAEVVRESVSGSRGVNTVALPVNVTLENTNQMSGDEIQEALEQRRVQYKGFRR